jgi:hydrogenase expression/formation protein HypD
VADTHTIFKYGIEDLLPENIEMIHGPGCPVCVIPLGRVDDAISIAQQPDVIFTTFGDAMRVPGSKTSLLDAKAAGGDSQKSQSDQFLQSGSILLTEKAKP